MCSVMIKEYFTVPNRKELFRKLRKWTDNWKELYRSRIERPTLVDLEIAMIDDFIRSWEIPSHIANWLSEYKIINDYLQYGDVFYIEDEDIYLWIPDERAL